MVQEDAKGEMVRVWLPQLCVPIDYRPWVGYLVTWYVREKSTGKVWLEKETELA